MSVELAATPGLKGCVDEELAGWLAAATPRLAEMNAAIKSARLDGSLPPKVDDRMAAFIAGTVSKASTPLHTRA